MDTTRRNFLTGCGTAAVAASLGKVTFAVGPASPASAANDGILVVVFCRGGWDSLSLVPPHDDAIYATQRGSLAVSGALAIDPQNSTFKTSVGLHPKAAPLAELYRQRSLAIVHACGLNDDTRSHFEAMDYIERGTPGDKSTSSGWITRHLQIVGEPGTLPTVAIGSTPPVSLLADASAVSMNNINSYGLSAPGAITTRTIRRCSTRSKESMTEARPARGKSGSARSRPSKRSRPSSGSAAAI